MQTAQWSSVCHPEIGLLCLVQFLPQPHIVELRLRTKDFLLQNKAEAASISLSRLYAGFNLVVAGDMWKIKTSDRALGVLVSIPINCMEY